MIQNCCKKCNSINYIKSGFIRGHQRYKCKDCGCQFTDTNIRGVHPAIKKLATVLYGLGGMSMLKIGKIFGVSDVAVLKWMRSESAKISDLKPHAESGIVMIDEMWHFVSGKKTRFGSGEPLMGSLVACSGGYVVIAPMLR